MFRIIVTCDYEIYGNGDGSPLRLCIEPTRRTLDLFNKYGAKLTIMAEMAEIAKFREYYEINKRDDFYYQKIVSQLQDAIVSGHDVQLHIHSSYFKAKYDHGKWNQNYNEYNLSGLELNRITEIIRQSKDFLESILRPVKPDYKCIAFRAANWAMVPTRSIAQALVNNGITIDTSVFQYGKRHSSLVKFDYSQAPDALIPWQVDLDDICQKSDHSGLFEFPIYCEKRGLVHFISVNRIYNVLMEDYLHRLDLWIPLQEPKKTEGRTSLDNSMKAGRFSSVLGQLSNKYAWKLDYNLCTGRELTNSLKRIREKYHHLNSDLPIVLIGHSKCFTRYNEYSLKSFLKFISQNSSWVVFGTFRDWKLPFLSTEY